MAKRRIEKTDVLKKLIRLDDILLKSPLWAPDPETVPLQYATVEDMPVRWYEQGVDRLKIKCSAGVLNAIGMKILAVLLWLAQCFGREEEMYVHPVEILKLLHMTDSGQNREMLRDFVEMCRNMTLEYRGYFDGDEWEYLVFGVLDDGFFIPIGRNKGMFKIKFNRTFNKMMSGKGLPDSRYIQIDVAKYSQLSGRYAPRLYELFKQNLTYRHPDSDGIIRWHVGAEKLRKKIGVEIPVKELTRNIKDAIEQFRIIAEWNIGLRLDGELDYTVYHFSTNRRLDWDEISGRSAAVPRTVLTEELLLFKLVTNIMVEIRKVDPGYPQGKEKTWRRALGRLFANGRQASDIWKVWKSVHDDGKAGSIYHAAVSLNPWRFANSFVRLLAAQKTS